MFSFLKRKAQQDLHHFLLKLINQKTGSRTTICENQRLESRAALNLGVWVIPVKDGEADPDTAFTAVTRDLSSAGASIISDRQLADDVLIQLPGDPEPRIVSASVCGAKDLGCGWAVYNLNAKELLDPLTSKNLLIADNAACGACR